MARTKLKRATILCAILLLVAGLVVLVSTRVTFSPLRWKKILQTDMLPRAGKWNQGMDKLWALGPDVIPRLAREANRRDTIFSRNYPWLWQKSPRWLKQKLPPPVNIADVRQAAMKAISEFGPLAARRAAPRIIAGLSAKDDLHNNYYAVGSLRWLLPESKAAMAAFTYGLSGADTNWPHSETFLNLSDDQVGTNSVWLKMPEVVPLLTNFLHNAAYAYMAAIPLGRVGSNAAPAIPALIQTLDMGAAGFTNSEDARNPSVEVFSNPIGLHLAKVRQDNQSINHNRAMAALALGRIGIATPEVRAALAHAWNARDPWVRHNAALAVTLLGPPMTNELPALLSGLLDKDNSALDTKLQAIGKLGPDARNALATLRQLTQTNFVQSLVTNKDTQVVGWAIADLTLTAKMAICRINPDEGRPFLPEITDGIGHSWETVVFLTEPGPLSSDIIRAVEPLLDETNHLRQAAAAYIILAHDQRHVKALALLRQNRSAGELNDRLFAGRLLFESIGETNALCDIITEAFQDSRSFIGQGAGQLAEKMGTNALPALPAFKTALWHKDRFVRERAGTLVLKLSPQDLPINEPK